MSKWVSDGGVGEDPDVVLLDEFITSLGGKGKILPAMDPKKKWTVKIVQRGAEGGATGGAYKVYFSPAGERFESRTAVARRLGLMESDANPLAVALVPGEEGRQGRRREDFDFDFDGEREREEEERKRPSDSEGQEGRGVEEREGSWREEEEEEEI